MITPPTPKYAHHPDVDHNTHQLLDALLEMRVAQTGVRDNIRQMLVQQ
jgi:hypothetical protein